MQECYLREVRAPLMAQPAAVEQVDPAGVVYKLPEGDVQVRFEVEGYRLL